MAYLRAKHNGCKLVLGSATPAVDTYKRAIDGEFGLIRLKNRINQKPLPEIVIADMRREVRRGKQLRVFRGAPKRNWKNALRAAIRRSCF